MRTVTAIMLAASPAFAGGHGHGGHGGGHGNASHSSSHASAKADRASARADRKAEHKAAKAAAVTISPGTWHQSFVYSNPTVHPGADAPSVVTMQPNGRFTAATPDDSRFNGKVNAKTGAVKAKGSDGLRLKGTYYDPLDGPDDTDRAPMAGDILGKHGITLGTFFAGGPELTEP